MKYVSKVEKHILKGSAGILLCLLLVFAVSRYEQLPNPPAAITQTMQTIGLTTPAAKVNILVLGVDERQDDVGRSDTAFVVTIDPDSKQVSMLSIPRDTRVKINGYGWDKINSAYAYGGTKLAKETVENLLGITIDNTVQINFSGFVKAINAIGGVTIDVDKRMSYVDPYDDQGGLAIDLRPGVQHLNGQQAIEYVRYRDEEGDIGRVARQQKFLKAVFNELDSPQIISKIPDLIRAFSQAVRTDLPAGKMLQLASIVKDASQTGLQTEMVGGTPRYIDDISYWLPDIATLREQVAHLQGKPTDAQYKAATDKMAAEYAKSLPNETKAVPTGSIVRKANPSATAAPNKARVEIINASGDNQAGEKMASILLARGFEVIGINNSSNNIRRNTLITMHVVNNAVIDKLSSIPFHYVVQMASGNVKDEAITVTIGQDFV